MTPQTPLLLPQEVTKAGRTTAQPALITTLAGGHLDCPRCRARFHTGVIYEPLDRCPRCGALLGPPRPSFRERFRDLLRLRGPGEAPDWETITSSQYTRRGLTGADVDGETNTRPRAPARVEDASTSSFR